MLGNAKDDPVQGKKRGLDGEEDEFANDRDDSIVGSNFLEDVEGDLLRLLYYDCDIREVCLDNPSEDGETNDSQQLTVIVCLKFARFTPSNHETTATDEEGDSEKGPSECLLMSGNEVSITVQYQYGPNVGMSDMACRGSRTFSWSLEGVRIFVACWGYELQLFRCRCKRWHLPKREEGRRATQLYMGVPPQTA